MRATLSRGWNSVKSALQSNPLKAVSAVAVVAALGAVMVARHLSSDSGAPNHKRWNAVEGVDDATQYSIPRLAVYSVPDIKPAHALPTLRDLGDLAQSRAIEVMLNASGQGHAWEDLRKALTDSPEPGEKDPFLFDRVLVVTVGRGMMWLPGDRVVRTEISVTPRNFAFAAYTIAATDTETVKVSSVEATEVRKLPSDIGLTFPGLGDVKVSGLSGRENTTKTTADVSSQFEQLVIDITPETLRIFRESGAGGDVVGNTRISLSMTTDAVKILDGAENRAGRPKDEIVLAVTGLNLDAKPPTMDVVPLVPLPHCALRATVSAVFDQRHVVRGREFYDEALQDVRFTKDVIRPPSDVVIAGADDVSPFVWSIQLVPPSEQPDKDWKGGTWHALNASTSDKGAMRRIVFSDYGRAVKLAHWVRTHAADSLASTPTGSPVEKAGVYTFNFRDAMFHDKTDHGLAVIKQTKDSCKETSPEPVLEEKVMASK